MHNIEEKHAKKCATLEAEGLGHPKGTEVCKAMCEAARIAVLDNEEFRDAALSEAGFEEAIKCEEQLQKLAKTLNLKQPGEVLVSPLQRTLQTASAMFPNHPKVRVCELLRERQTGRPCDDCRQSTAQDPSFAKMDWFGLMKCSEADMAAKTGAVVEDVAMLRRRTGQLAAVLRGSSAETICIITHKGYLRELERGPLGRPDATEFTNCEVRVYDVELPIDGTMVASLQYCQGETPPEPKPHCCNLEPKTRCSLTVDEVNQPGAIGNVAEGFSTETPTPNEKAKRPPRTEKKALRTNLYQFVDSLGSSSAMPEKEIVACF